MQIKMLKIIPFKAFPFLLADKLIGVLSHFMFAQAQFLLPGPQEHSSGQQVQHLWGNLSNFGVCYTLILPLSLYISPRALFYISFIVFYWWQKEDEPEDCDSSAVKVMMGLVVLMAVCSLLPYSGSHSLRSGTILPLVARTLGPLIPSYLTSGGLLKGKWEKQ